MAGTPSRAERRDGVAHERLGLRDVDLGGGGRGGRRRLAGADAHEGGAVEARPAHAPGRGRHGARQAGAVVAGVAAGVEARHRRRHLVVDADGRELAEDRRVDLEERARRVGGAHPADQASVQNFTACGPVPHGAALHVLGGVGEHPVLRVERDQRPVAGLHLLVPDRAGHAAHVGLVLAAERRRELLVPGVVERVLGADEGLLAADAGELGEGAPLGVAHLRARTPGHAQSVAALAAPHAHDAVALAAGGDDRRRRLDHDRRAVEQVEADGAGDAAAVGEQVRERRLVDEAHAELARRALERAHEVEVHAGEAPGQERLEALVDDLSVAALELARPAAHALQHPQALAAEVGEQLLVLDVVADVLDVELDEGVDVVLGREVPPDAGPLVGLAGPTRRRLLDDEHVGVRVLLLGRRGGGEAADAAADHQDVGGLHPAELLERGHRRPPTVYGKPRSMTGGKSMSQSAATVMASSLQLISQRLQWHAVLRVRDERPFGLRVPADHVREARQVAGLAPCTGVEVDDDGVHRGRTSQEDYRTWNSCYSC